MMWVSTRRFTKGDKPGHAFRGNQWSFGSSGIDADSLAASQYERLQSDGFGIPSDVEVDKVSKGPKPSLEVKAEIASYCDEGYKSTNAALRASNGASMSDSEKKMNEHLAKHVMQKDTILYRTVAKQTPIDNAVVGDEIYDSGFISTSLYPGGTMGKVNAVGSAPTLLRIIAPEGTRGRPVHRISPVGEAEVLLPAGLTLKVVGVSIVNGGKVVTVDIIGQGLRDVSITKVSPKFVTGRGEKFRYDQDTSVAVNNMFTNGTKVVSKPKRLVVDQVSADLAKADDPLSEANRNRSPAERVRISVSRMTARERDVYRAVQDAVAALSSSADSALVRRLIAEGVDSVLNDISVGSFISELSPMVTALRDEAIRAGVNHLPQLPNNVGLRMRFDYLDPRAVAWANQRAGELVTAMADEQRNVLRNVISQGIQDQITVDEMARNVRDVVGLPETWAEAVPRSRENEFVKLIKEGKTVAQATSLADAYATKYKTRLVNARAKTIARTEIMSAQNQGRWLSWAQGIEQGFIPKDAKKEWIAAPGFGPAPKTCDRCKPMDGVTAKWDDAFPGTDVLIPPLHPNCRCTAVLVPLDIEQLERLLEVPESAVTIASGEMDELIEIEPELTESVSELANRMGGEPVGLEHRIKSVNSFARKAYFDSVQDGVSVQEAARNIKDGLRYTIRIPNDRYAGSVRDYLLELERQGVQFRSKIRWEGGDIYRGVNLQILDPKTRKWYEVQFHTPESYSAKQPLHEMYENWRTMKDTDPLKAQLRQRMEDLAGKVTTPTDIGSLLGMMFG